MSRWLPPNRYRWYFAALPIAGVAGLIVAATAFRSSAGEDSAGVVRGVALAASTGTAAQMPSPTPTPVRFGGILDGLAMTEAEWDARKDLRPVAVMIDNSPAAYPQSGLDRADLVYEAFVEGGITRFMAVYWRQEADYIEPTRSARTPFVVWADELGVLYGHAGGAATENDANAIGQIAEWGISDLNAFEAVASSAYHRDEKRYSPHNLVADTAALREAAGRLGYGAAPPPAMWPFKRDGEGTASLPEGRGIQVEFSRDYRGQLIQWHWDEATHSYLRFQWGGPAVDGRTGAQLHFPNVVVMRAPWHVADDDGHVLVDQFGEGPATIYLDGKAVEATWRKADRKARTRFYAADGAEVAFNRGPIFIEVVGPDSPVLTTAVAEDLPPIPHYDPPGSAAGPDNDNAAPTATATPAATATPTPAETPGATPSAAAGTAAPASTPGPTTPTRPPSASPVASSTP